MKNARFDSFTKNSLSMPIQNLLSPCDKKIRMTADTTSSVIASLIKPNVIMKKVLSLLSVHDLTIVVMILLLLSTTTDLQAQGSGQVSPGSYDWHAYAGPLETNYDIGITIEGNQYGYGGNIRMKARSGPQNGEISIESEKLEVDAHSASMKATSALRFGSGTINFKNYLQTSVYLTLDQAKAKFYKDVEVLGTISAPNLAIDDWNTAYTERGSQIAGTGLSWSSGTLNVSGVLSDDQTASEVVFNNTASGLTAIAVQGAIDELNQKIANKEGSRWSEASGNISYPSNVSIGTTVAADGYLLSVEGKAVMEEVNILLKNDWPDYVFKEDYNLRPLKEVEAFVKENNHLPEVPSAAEVHENGIMLGEMNAKLLKKMEEMTLYMIQQADQIEQLQQRLGALEASKKP